MARNPDLRDIEKLRAWRNSPPRDLAIRAPAQELAKGVRDRARTFGSLGAAWRELAPAPWRDSASLVALSRGVLTVRCADAASKFELDRWLRAGGEIQLVKRAAARLNRVKLVL